MLCGFCCKCGGIAAAAIIIFTIIDYLRSKNINWCKSAVVGVLLCAMCCYDVGLVVAVVCRCVVVLSLLSSLIVIIIVTNTIIDY